MVQSAESEAEQEKMQGSQNKIRKENVFPQESIFIFFLAL